MKPGKSNTDTAHYVQTLPAHQSAICQLLHREITSTLPRATSKIWHAIPVWFVDENPVVGYQARTKYVNLLFWNGQALGDPALKPVGKFKAAQIQFTDVSEIDSKTSPLAQAMRPGHLRLPQPFPVAQGPIEAGLLVNPVCSWNAVAAH